MKKLLITGSSGMLGSNLVKELGDKYEIFGIYKDTPNPALKNQFQCDIVNATNMAKILNLIKPQFVIHCAAMTNVESCEKDYSAAYEINASATEKLVSNLNNGTKVVYISTDSVFDGETGNYTELSKTFPLNRYAQSKLQGEYFVEKGLKNFIIIRTNFFGWNLVSGSSFAEWVFDSICRSETIRMFTDVIFSPLVATKICFFIDKLLDADYTGRINLGSSDCMSKYDFGVCLAKKIGLDPSLIKPVSIDEFKFNAKRPKNTALDISKAGEIFGPLPTVEEGVEEFCEHRRKKAA